MEHLSLKDNSLSGVLKIGVKSFTFFLLTSPTELDLDNVTDECVFVNGSLLFIFEKSSLLTKLKSFQKVSYLKELFSIFTGKL